jgi:hypothetical protein
LGRLDGRTDWRRHSLRNIALFDAKAQSTQRRKEER